MSQITQPHSNFLSQIINVCIKTLHSSKSYINFLVLPLIPSSISTRVLIRSLHHTKTVFNSLNKSLSALKASNPLRTQLPVHHFSQKCNSSRTSLSSLSPSSLFLGTAPTTPAPAPELESHFIDLSGLFRAIEDTVNQGINAGINRGVAGINTG
ncbi:hypothetical protein L873DRAFT_1842123 [Choiromyces venosus 120613-1]|uniref:Uncharacterized protein n=1 Tax=Choiromyces venosus 120613-1 TaxID=1336337 RepID=A0A3N4JYN4_9PEZI|nr:hypothetical protein L873DRAFT_1842123 [Choiromyces venosus 120613-1]